MRTSKKIGRLTTACILALTVLLLSLPLSVMTVSAAEATDTLLALFTYNGGTAGENVTGDKDAGYAATLGDATLFASINGTSSRKLEWTADPYASSGNTQAAMTGGNKNPWAAGAYLQVKLSTVGYTDLHFSAQLGGTKKGPRDFQLQYSLDGVEFYDIDGASYSISSNKTMETAFDRVALPAEASNAETLYIRIAVDSDTLINGSTGLAGSTGGETAINGIRITGTGEVRFYPQGDINRDGKVTTSDMRDILLVTLGKVTAEGQAALLADVDQNGKIETTDVRTGLLALMQSDEAIYSVEANTQEQSSPTDSENRITLNGTTATVTGNGVTVDGSMVTVNKAGTYYVSGTLTDGQLVVEADSSADKVVLMMEDTTISNSTSAPLYIKSADKTTLVLTEGTTTTLNDATSYIYAQDEDEPSAALFSKDDLIIEGSGTLVVNANYKNGIVSKDDLKIKGGTISVTAPNHGIRGKDSVQITDGTITVVAGADGVQSDNTEDATRGYITIDGGTLTVTAGNDGIQAQTSLQVNGGSLNVTTGGGSTTSPSSSDTNSYKGLKCSDGLILTTGGSFVLNCKDDAVHAASVTLSGGTFRISSGDDGIHSDSSLIITDPTAITVTKSYEAVEGVDITVSGGTLRLTSSDDGVNGAGGTDSGEGYWYMENGLLYVVSETTAGYELSLLTDASFDIAQQPYLVLDYSSSTPYDIAFNLSAGSVSATPTLASEWYSDLENTSADGSSYLPSTTGSKTAALDLREYFTNAGIPTDKPATVTQVTVKLQGAGRICIGALQVSDSTQAVYYDMTATGTAISATDSIDGVCNLMEGIASVTSSSGGSTGNTSGFGPNAGPGNNGMESETSGSLTITGGYIAVYAGGDGIDVNGSAVMTDGTVIVHGPSDGGNGALDYDDTFTVDGGLLIAVGYRSMAQTPSNSSSQNTIHYNGSTTRSGGTAFGLKDSSGNTIVAFTPTKSYQSVVICSPDLVKGTTYTAYIGGSCAGTETDGLYTGAYSGGTSVGSARINATVTTISGNGNGRF